MKSHEEFKGPAFENPRLIKKYRRILKSWNGTPYKHLVCHKGRGADCTLLVGASLKELGVLRKVEHEYYPRGWHMSTTKEWVLESFYHHIKNHLRNGFGLWWRHQHVEEEDFIFGDVITFATTAMKVSNHCGIWLDKRKAFYNSIHQRGCCELTYGGWWDKRQTGVLRVMET